jgi:quinol monooxygenase YgiN
MIMDQVAIWAVVESKPGKENEVEAFLKSAQPLAEREPETTSWYAVRIGPSKFGIFDTFPDEKGRQAHLTGEIAKALFAKAPELFSKEPEIHKLSILASKTPKATGAAAGHRD